jgi:hypothetical protein
MRNVNTLFRLKSRTQKTTNPKKQGDMRTYIIRTNRTDGECYYYVTAKSATKALRTVLTNETSVMGITSID